MKCSNCGHNQFHQSVTVELKLSIVVDEKNKFCDFVGDINDIIQENDIIDRDSNWVCTECDTPYDFDDMELEDEDEDMDVFYDTVAECVQSGQHLTDVDDDGICNFCGYKYSEE